MDEYRVKVTIRNNLLLSAIESAGFKSQTEFAESIGISGSAVNALVALRSRPIGQEGEFSVSAKAVMEGLGAAPSDLWTDQQLMMKLKTNTGERTVGEDQVQMILENHLDSMLLSSPDEDIEKSELVDIVGSALDRLTQRESRIISLRFGLKGEDEHTLDETAKLEGVTRERIRQIEAKGMRKLRNPILNPILNCA